MAYAAPKCPGCGEPALAENFYISKDGELNYYCKMCQTFYNRKNLGTKMHTEAHRRAVRKYQRKWPERERACSTLIRAVETGEIVRPDKCSKCGEPCTPHGHHEDYSLPLAVIWLCRKCHRDRSEELKRRKIV